MNFTKDFIVAFNHAMLYEIGPWFDANDADTIAGKIDTPLQRRKCGYTNIVGDNGGVTKFGIAQNKNPNVDVPNLDLNTAMQVYFNGYWVQGACDRITIPITIFQFDMCVNNGISRAGKILQQAVGATIDGNVGPATLAKVNQQDSETLVKSLSVIREDRYKTIVQNDPSQAKFLAGWLRRNTEVTQFSLAQLALIKTKNLS
jgi:lysozyme family protein